jgi:hypothetical protein
MDKLLYVRRLGARRFISQLRRVNKGVISRDEPTAALSSDSLRNLGLTGGAKRKIAPRPGMFAT